MIHILQSLLCGAVLLALSLLHLLFPPRRFPRSRRP